MEEEITNKQVLSAVNDVLEAVNLFATNVDKRFDGVENELKVLENKMDGGFASVRSELDGVKNDLLERINKLDNTTKQDTDVIVRDYLDIKIRVKKLEQQVQQLQPV